MGFSTEKNKIPLSKRGKRTVKREECEWKGKEKREKDKPIWQTVRESFCVELRVERENLRKLPEKVYSRNAKENSKSTAEVDELFIFFKILQEIP